MVDGGSITGGGSAGLASGLASTCAASELGGCTNNGGALGDCALKGGAFTGGGPDGAPLIGKPSALTGGALTGGLSTSTGMGAGAGALLEAAVASGGDLGGALACKG